MDEIQVQHSSSSEVRDLLFDAGLDRAQAVALMGNRPQGQRPGGQKECEPSPTIQRDQGTGRSKFERTVMETMQRLSQRLDSLAEKVEGNDERSNVMESPLNAGSLPTLWADRPLDESLDSLPTPRWDNEEETTDMENGTSVQVSESTQKVIKAAFGS